MGRKPQDALSRQRAAARDLLDYMPNLPPFLAESRKGLLCGDSRPADVEPDDWFPAGQGSRGQSMGNRRAITLCGLCPAQLECGRWAIETGQQHGIWGGRTPEQREGDLRKRGREVILMTRGTGPGGGAGTGPSGPGGTGPGGGGGTTSTPGK